MYLELIVVSIYVTTNVLSFFIMARDKGRSVRSGNIERTPEGLIFFMATAFGAVGVYAGMLAFRHKTKKWYFQLGIPLLILQNIATIYMVWQFFFKN